MRQGRRRKRNDDPAGGTARPQPARLRRSHSPEAQAAAVSAAPAAAAGVGRGRLCARAGALRTPGSACALCCPAGELWRWWLSWRHLQHTMIFLLLFVVLASLASSSLKKSIEWEINNSYVFTCCAVLSSVLKSLVCSLPTREVNPVLCPAYPRGICLPL